MSMTAFVPILSALDRLALAHVRGPQPEDDPRVTHVAFGTLVDYVRGLGSAAAREEVREHLAVCAHCERTASGLARLAEIAAAEMHCDVPDDVIDEAIALFTADPSDRQALTEIGGLFAGESRLAPLDDESRAVTAGQPRFLSFALPGGEIDVRLLVVEEQDGVSVSGQIMARAAGSSAAGWEITAHRTAHDQSMAQARATTGGLFQLRYDLPAAALLRFVNAGTSTPVDVAIDPESPTRT